MANFLTIVCTEGFIDGESETENKLSLFVFVAQRAEKSIAVSNDQTVFVHS